MINSKFFRVALFMISCYANICTGQTSSIDTGVSKKLVDNINVIQLTNLPPLISRDLILNPKFVEHLDLPHKGEFEKTYGNADVVFIITPKPGTIFLSLLQVFDKFNIDEKYRNYPILIDRTETKDPKTLIADAGSIEKVMINKERKYIEIITTYYKEYTDLKNKGRDFSNPPPEQSQIKEGKSIYDVLPGQSISAP